jgi:hypothetical protein
MIAQPDLDRPQKPTEWTLMFYFASDNPLAPSIVSQLKAIKDAGFHPDANVIARFDPNTAETPTHIFEVNLINKLKEKNSDKVSFGNDPFVRSLVEDKLWGEYDVDSNDLPIRERIANSLKLIRKDINYNPPRLQERGKPEDRQKAKGPGNSVTLEPDSYTSLETFLDFCATNYPARHYILFFLGHGIIVGNDIFLADENVDKGPKSLTLKNLGKLLGGFKGKIKDKDPKSELELISFHSCSLSGLEVAYELKDCAKYMLASQGPAFVGSWPYRNILIRVFNDLNSAEFTSYDFKDVATFVKKLKSDDSPVSNFLRAHLSPEGTKLLDKIEQNPSDQKLVEKFAKELNEVLAEPEMVRAVEISRLSESALHLVDRSKHDRRMVKRRNRRLMLETYPEELERINIKRMLIRIFHYVLFNSYDYQLAGYSFDVCLTDLSKLSDDMKPAVKASLDALAEALKEGLPKTNSPEEATLAGKLILLSHLEAQSYWNENYTDLYDFCMVLQQSCTAVGDGAPGIKKIREACEVMIGKLEPTNGSSGAFVPGLLTRGLEGNDDGRLIVRSECAGPTYQYSRGLSIFFPWTEPVGSKMWDVQYANYNLIDFKAESIKGWMSFLKQYFQSTVRRTRGDLDASPQELAALSAETSRVADNETLTDADLLEAITGIVFNASGQLKAGPKDTTGKGGSNDPTGDDDCGCASIKNYPKQTQATPGMLEGLHGLITHETSD